MSNTAVEKTQDTLGKIIKKPLLTQKLLGRPPFRFLHDIFTEVIRTTGFMKGLYSESELKADNVKDKESKMNFLQKALDVVILVSGEPLAAKPGHIVAGHEPEKTNELLQAIAKCCLNKMSSDDAVKRVLSGEKVDSKTKPSTSRLQDKENREGGERRLDREEKKNVKEHSATRAQKTPDQPKEQESRRRHGEKQEHRDKDRTAKHHRSEQDRHTNDHDNDRKPAQDHQGKDYERKRRQDRDHHAKDHDRDERRDRDHHSKDRDRDVRRDKDRDRHKEGRARERDKDDRDRDREKEKEKKRDRERTRERDPDRERDKEKRRDRDKEQDKQTERYKEGAENSENGIIKARVSEEPQQTTGPEELSKSPPAEPKPEEQSDGPARIPRPSSAKGQRRRPNIGNQAGSDSEGDGDVQLDQKPESHENGIASVSDVAPRKIPRPSSARPAPPPVRRQESYTDLAQSERMSSAKPLAPVIMDGKRLSEDEDGQFVIDVVPPPPDALVMQEPAQNLDSEDKHGGLVKKILETKRDYESSPRTKPNVVSEEARQKQRDMVAQELERLDSSIQMVCSSTLPLGTCMNYVQEDMDAMHAERQNWRQKNQEYAQALLQEKRETDRVLYPLLVELSELELLIKKEQEKIFTSKANILKNRDKIQKMTGKSFSPES
ncbi:TRAF3-interacting protein 1 isoform X2 [Antennarius striatus]|uniref:TRAF3-interacting protein 1 isoform X2 n=1 Tax=Antennarius striatus TaxID=241820 RepID=UPI0035B146F2